MNIITFTTGYLLKIEGLVTDVTSLGFPDKAECDILEMIFGIFASSGCYYGRGGTLRFEIPLLSLNNVT